MKSMVASMVVRRVLFSFVALWAFVCGVAMSAEDVAELGKVEVTGSHIKRVDIEGPSPILVIDREEIDRVGVDTLSQLLRRLPQSTGAGSFDDKFISSFAPGSSGISLRGLGQDSTLVLLNGRRVSNYGFANELTDTFVDLNSIPLGAIERIEILKDGASATYGSDAIAGVVNIILRRDFDGSEIGLGYGVSSENDGNETTLNYVGGFNDSKGNVTVVLDYFKRDDISRDDRKFSKSADHSNKEGGIDFTSLSNPVANVFDTTFNPLELNGTYDFNPLVTLVPKTERYSALIDLNRELTSSLGVFGQFMYSQAKSDSQVASNPVFGDVLVPAGQAFNTFGQDVFTLWRMIEMGPRETDVENDLYRAMAGLEGLIGAWDWSAAVNYNRSKTVLDGYNFVGLPQLDTAVNNDTINPFGTSSNSQAVLDGVRVPIGRTGEFDLYGADAKVSGDVAELPAGPIALAVGGEWRHEELKDEPDDLSAQGLVVGVATTSADGDRDVSALFTEVNIPLMENMELQLAGRYEDYNDFGSTTNPKVALRYQPIHQVVLRASWGTGFRAPSLAELYLGDTSSFDFLVDTTRCNAVGLGCAPDQYFIVTSGNEDLDAEDSTSYYIGAVFEPLRDLTVGVDYWNYKVDDVIDQDVQFVVDNELQTSGGVERGAPTVPGDPGPIVQVNDSFFNIAEQETDGIDLDIRYQLQVGGVGTFSIHELATRMLSFDRQATPGAANEDLLETYRFPKWRSVTTLAWMRSDYAASIIANYIDDYEDKFNPDLEVDSSLTYDVQFVYSGFTNSAVTLGIENLTDDTPPFANEEEGYDFATHDPRGRFFYARYKYAFN